MEGSLPKDAKFAVVKADNLPELQAMADAHDLPSANAPLALIVWDFDPAKQSAPSKAAFKWFLTDRGALQLPVVPLGDKLPDLPPEPKVKKVEAPADTEHVAVRITVRQEFVASNWAAIKRNPVQALMSILPVGIEVRTYGWREAAVDGRTQLVGYAKVCPDKVASVLAVSGKKGLFLEPLQCNLAQVKAPVQWIPKLSTEDMEQYFARVFTQAQASKLPLACMRGGGACLGLRDGSVTVTGALKWTVAGVPSHWGPGTFQQLARETRLGRLQACYRS